MKKQILAVVLSILFAMPAQAGYNDKIQELIALMNLNEQEQYMNTQVILPLVCSFDMPATEETNIKTKVSEILNFKNKMIEIVTPLWQENFTEQELDEILAFYRTDVGKKTIALMPKISQYVTQSVIEYQKEITPQINDIVSDLISKYNRRSDTEVQLCVRRNLR